MPARVIPLDYDLLTDLYVTKRMTIRAIARHFGTDSSGSVLRTVRQLGITRPERALPDCKMSQLREIQSLYSNGFTTKAIAGRFGWSPSYIQKLLHGCGELLRRAGRPSSGVICKIAGCGELVHLVKQHGYDTGTMCLNHRRQHYANLGRISYRVRHNTPPDKWRKTKWQC